ncbi:TolC family protein [Hyalangium versicolor]|uniref:TolC family protein n=1 Tax=Hyalangium versicolor TaxID=2861190 RepID=UPI001CCC43DB|nr:TolC family protein [Hyalangium versicolor]
MSSPVPLHLPLLLGLLAAQPAAAAAPLTLARAIALALERSPALIPLEAELARARAQAQGASLLLQSNPELSAAAGPRLRTEGRSLDLGLGVSQRLEIFGQRGARREAAQALVEASEARLQARRVELAAKVREAFARTLAAEQVALLAQDAQTLAIQALTAAEERLSAGAASRLEVNTARVEAGRAAREQTRAYQRQSSTLSELRLLLGLQADEEVRLDGSLQPGKTPELSLQALLAQALRQRADLRAAQAEVTAAQAERDLAAREALPSPRIGATYSREEDAQIIQGTLAVDLPVFNRNQAARGVGTARVAETERQREALERAAHAEVRLALTRYQAAEKAVSIFGEDALIALQENLELATEGYRAGKMDFLELLVIRRETLDARRDYIEALEELGSAQAQLQRVIGSIQ